MDALRRSFDVPLAARLVVCGEPLGEPYGELTRDAGIREALWAADILKYLFDDLYLLVLGDGPELGLLKKFARDIRVHDRVRFLARRTDWRRLVVLADLVWAPVHKDIFPLVVEEALAARRPIIAANRPRLRTAIQHGQTGFLFPPGDTAGLARLSRLILDGAWQTADCSDRMAG